MRCMYAGDNACYWYFLARSHPRGWWAGGLLCGDPIMSSGVILVCAVVRGCDYSLHPNAQYGTLYAIVTVLVLAMWLLISA